MAYLKDIMYTFYNNFVRNIYLKKSYPLKKYLELVRGKKDKIQYPKQLLFR